MSFYFAGEIDFAVSYFRASMMSFYGLRLAYALEGISNYITWKYMMEAVLEDKRLKEFIDKYISKPPAIDAQDLVEWRKCVAKVRSIILEGVGNHIISNIHSNETPYAMWKALKELFQNISDQRKLALKDKLRKMKMKGRP